MRNLLQWIGWIGLLALAVGCANLSVAAGWDREVVRSFRMRVSGCSVGDLDPDRPGLEIATVAGDGSVWLCSSDGITWSSERIATLPGEMVQCAIGDADLDAPGLELVVVGIGEGSGDDGGAGRAYVIRKVAGGGFEAEPMFEDSALLSAVAVERGEVFCAGRSALAFRVVHGPTGWRSNKIATLPGGAKAAVVVRSQVVFACADGSVIGLTRDGAGWSSGVLDRRNAVRAQLGTDGARIVVADEDGQLTMIAEDGRPQRLFRAHQRLTGAVLAELDSGVPGVEAATVGFDRQLVVIRRIDGDWQPWVVGEEIERIRAMACGDLDPAPGLEIVVVGYAGDLVIYRRAR